MALSRLTIGVNHYLQRYQGAIRPLSPDLPLNPMEIILVIFPEDWYMFF